MNENTGRGMGRGSYYPTRVAIDDSIKLDCWRKDTRTLLEFKARVPKHASHRNIRGWNGWAKDVAFTYKQAVKVMSWINTAPGSERMLYSKALDTFYYYTEDSPNFPVEWKGFQVTNEDGSPMKVYDIGSEYFTWDEYPLGSEE